MTLSEKRTLMLAQASIHRFSLLTYIFSLTLSGITGQLRTLRNIFAWGPLSSFKHFPKSRQNSERGLMSIMKKRKYPVNREYGLNKYFFALVKAIACPLKTCEGSLWCLNCLGALRSYCNLNLRRLRHCPHYMFFR